MDNLTPMDKNKAARCSLLVKLSCHQPENVSTTWSGQIGTEDDFD